MYNVLIVFKNERPTFCCKIFNILKIYLNEIDKNRSFRINHYQKRISNYSLLMYHSFWYSMIAFFQLKINLLIGYVELY